MFGKKTSFLFHPGNAILLFVAVMTACTTAGVIPAPTALTPLPPLVTGEGIEASGLKTTEAGLSDTPRVRELLAAWRKPDKNNMACAHCHAPDGFDLALLNISDENIQRRANFHVDPATTAKILELIHLVRQSNKITAPKDPQTFRPLQPTGKVLPGDTLAERDYALLNHLKSKLPTLFLERISTVQEATQAKDELMRYNPRKEPIGVEFPRWSEDGFHSPANGTLNDWLTERPMVGKTSGDDLQLFALHDTYIFNPTPRNLWAIENAFNHIAKPGLMLSEGAKQLSPQAADWAKTKASSTLFGQHLLRMEHFGKEDTALRVGFPVMMTADYKVFDPFFAFGDFGNERSRFEPLLNGGLPPEFMAGLSPERRTPEGFAAMFQKEVLVPWWVMGWTFTPGENAVPNWYEYFPQSLLGGRRSGHNLPVHFTLITAKLAGHRTFTELLGKNVLTNKGVMPSHLELPNEENDYVHSDHKQMHQRMMLNQARMSFLLSIEETNSQCAKQGKATRFVLGDANDLETTLRNWLTNTVAKISPATLQADGELLELAMRTREKGYHNCVAPFVGQGTGLTAEVFTDWGLSTKLAGQPSQNNGLKIWLGCKDFHDPDNDIVISLSGTLKPRYSGAHRFGVSRFATSSQSGMTVEIDGKVVFDSQTNPSQTLDRAVDLTAGKAYAIRILTSLSNNCGSQGNGYTVLWRINNAKLMQIPAESVYPKQ
jgi:PA14 domain